jgi:hypothetical protein
VKHFCLIATLLCLMGASCYAEDSLQAAVDSAFARGQYEQVELLALRHAPELPARSVETRVAVNLTTGYALIMLGREADAEAYFRRALDADPATRLDPVRISPKFRRVFESVKAAYRPPEPVPVMTAPQPMGPRMGPVLSNLLLPGTGQFLEGRHERGLLWAGAELALAGVFVWRWQEYQNSRDAYVREMDRAKVHEAYDRYAGDYQIVWAVGAAAGVVYLASQVDLALLRHAGQSVAISASGTTSGLALNFRW